MFPPVHDAVTEEEEEIQKVLDGQAVKQQKMMASAICEGQESLTKVMEIADELHELMPYELTASTLIRWSERLKELVFDLRQVLSDMNKPLAPLPGKVVTASLKSSQNLAHAQRLQQSLLKALKSEGKDFTTMTPIFHPQLQSPTSFKKTSLPSPKARKSHFCIPVSNNVSSVRPLDPMIILSPKAPNPPMKKKSTAACLHRMSAGIKCRITDQTGLPKNIPDATCVNFLSAAVYLVLEAVVQQVRADKGVLFRYLPAKDELQAVACVGSGLPPSNQIRLPPSAGLVGTVFTSRIAINIITSHVARESLGFKCGNVASLLCLPVFDHLNNCVGVMLHLNKYRGLAPFTPEDETTVFSTLKTCAYLMNKYPVDFGVFNPLPFHAVVPLKSAELGMHELNSSGGNGTTKTADRYLVYRTQQHGKYLQKNLIQEKAESVSQQAQLQDVVNYVANLEACWDESVSSLMNVGSTLQGYSEQTRTMREQVRKKAKKIVLLKELARQYAQDNLKLTATLTNMKKELARFQRDT